MKVSNKLTGESFEFDFNSQIGKSTKTIYIRKGFKNETLFLSQKGDGDVCPLDAKEIEVKENLFNRLKIFSLK